MSHDPASSLKPLRCDTIWGWQDAGPGVVSARAQMLDLVWSVAQAMILLCLCAGAVATVWTNVAGL